MYDAEILSCGIDSISRAFSGVSKKLAIKLRTSGGQKTGALTAVWEQHAEQQKRYARLVSKLNRLRHDTEDTKHSLTEAEMQSHTLSQQMSAASNLVAADRK